MWPTRDISSFQKFSCRCRENWKYVKCMTSSCVKSPVLPCSDSEVAAVQMLDVVVQQRPGRATEKAVWETGQITKFITFSL